MKRIIGCSVMSLVIGGLFLAVVDWAVISYHVLVREEIEVEAHWSRIENGYQYRSSLAGMLVDRGRRGGGVDERLVENLAESCDRASRLVLSPEVLKEPERFLELQRVQAEQSHRISETLAGFRAGGSPSAATALDDLERRIRDADRGLAEERGRFNEAVRAYNGVLERPPMSWFARLYRFGPKPELEPERTSGGRAASVAE